MFTEFRVVWVECPTVANKARVLFVQAANAKDAEAVATDYIERRFGVVRFVVREVRPAAAVPAGKVGAIAGSR